MFITNFAEKKMLDTFQLKGSAHGVMLSSTMEIIIPSLTMMEKQQDNSL
jgi:hypothetical protein